MAIIADPNDDPPRLLGDGRASQVLRIITLVLVLAVLGGVIALSGALGDLNQDDKLIARTNEVTYCIGNLNDVRTDALLAAVDHQLDATGHLLEALSDAVADRQPDLGPAIVDITNGGDQVEYGLAVSRLMTDTRNTAADLPNDTASDEGRFTCPPTPEPPQPTVTPP